MCIRDSSERVPPCSPGPSSRTRSRTASRTRSTSEHAPTSGEGNEDNIKHRQVACDEDNQVSPGDDQTREKDEPVTDTEDEDAASAEQISIINEELSNRLRDYRAHGTTLLGVCDSLYVMTRRRRSPEVLLRRVRARGEREQTPVRFYPPPLKYLQQDAGDPEPE